MHGKAKQYHQNVTSGYRDNWLNASLGKTVEGCSSIEDKVQFSALPSDYMKLIGFWRMTTKQMVTIHKYLSHTYVLIEVQNNQF